MVILSGIWPRWWCLRRAGCWPRGTGTSLTGWLILLGRWLRPLRSTSGICWRREGRHQQSGPMGWTSCAGSGSFGLVPESPGIGRHASRPGISAGGCWSLASSPGRIGARRLRRGRPLRLVHLKRTRRRSVRIRRRCCGRFTTFTAMRGPANGVKLRRDGHQPEFGHGERCQPRALAGLAGLVPAACPLGLAGVAAAGPSADEVARAGDLEGQVGEELVKAGRGKRNPGR